jgi:hypothetical protein
MYEQTLYTVLKDYINPKILKKNNRYKKWEYGYNKEYDIVIISRLLERYTKFKISRLLYQQSLNALNEAKIKRNNTGKDTNTQKN